MPVRGENSGRVRLGAVPTRAVAAAWMDGFACPVANRRAKAKALRQRVALPSVREL
jgi:hypothetical protein